MALEDRLRAKIKDLIRQKGVTYSTIAQRLNVSESTVKRIMTTKKMTVDDFEWLCTALGLNSYDVFLAIHENYQYLDQLSFEQEDFLCRNPVLDYVWLKMNLGFKLESIQQELSLATGQLTKFLKKMEHYKLIRRIGIMEFVLLKKAPFKWLPDGPFEQNFKRLIVDFMLGYFKKSLKGKGGQDYLQSFEVYLTEDSYNELKAELDKLILKYRKKCRVEVVSNPSDQLKPYAFLIGTAQVNAWKSVLIGD